MADGYALRQLSQSFLTATTHEDPRVRRRADERARKWAGVLQGMADGTISIGSRTPIAGLPAWVTLDVLRGGFARQTPAAQTPVEREEIALAHRVGITPSRSAIFGYFLTDDGLARLWELLDSGGYRIDIPEDAALLSMAWLLRAGDRDGALAVLDALSPFADRFRLAPKPAQAPLSPPDHVFRITAGEAAATLRARKPKPRVEAWPGCTTGAPSTRTRSRTWRS